jgi:predicted lipoprotein with Yx(FWY)xxD motif
MDHGQGPRGRLAAIGAGVLFAVAACGGAASSAPTAAPSAAPSVAPSTAPSAAPGATASADEYEVTAATSASAGAYLAGADGRALYIFKKDTGTTSSCYDTCATAWPPFEVGAGEGATAGDGVTGTFGTTARTDGTTQVTYKGVPLYYYSGDAKAGDINGQGLNGVWFLATP